MVSIRTCGIGVIGAAVLALPSAATAAPPASLGAGTAKVHIISLIDPPSLPVGHPPAAAYITGRRGGPIYIPGRSPLATGAGGAQKFLTRARGGYLLTVADRTVRYVSDTGARHRVFRVGGSKYKYVRDVVVSRDGRSVALTVRSTANPGYDRVVVRRVAKSTTIAHHTFSIPVVVASLTARRALLTPDGLARWPDRSRMPTRWWNLRTGHLRTFDKAGRPGPGSDFSGFSVADMTSGQVALLRSDHNRVVTVPRRPGHAWSTRPHEWVLSWSPDDRFVLTAAWTPEKRRMGNQWDTLAIRRARDGRLVSRFMGFQNLYGNRWSPVWESDTTFVVDAEDTCDRGSCANITNVRCSVHGPCEQVALAGLPVGYHNVEMRRLPPS